MSNYYIFFIKYYGDWMKNILVLCGGNSFEYDISILSVKNIIKNIENLRKEIIITAKRLITLGIKKIQVLYYYL